ncbi:hypothetical protein P152DRAFT_503078 [Eremomyces bilateralis CBS 781.70]|uniref:Alpha-1,3-mannosyltransferase CMT1 n=1 Tax=Eremomyces bilateralis CBS 781.70 TaxID=1392243 RepID=A0A6G1G6F9_9PEZI|nr:uncharacterized protein P152DRAFT_503078 [Eremomyces bilateralis CBS 781.70]KAF1813541.1 hypothetical protein P152DRAFT_503078 [Eremomyces bilateralis CBS 781.70]
MRRSRPLAKRHSPFGHIGGLQQASSRLCRCNHETSSEHLPRLHCPPAPSSRYGYLREPSRSATGELLPKYLFALDIYQSAPVLSSLFGSIVESIRYLGPENCALSVVEGRSTDGTFEILSSLQPVLEGIGLKYYFQTSDIDPSSDRIQALAALRNLAIEPYTAAPNTFSESSTIIFINDIVLCGEDTLEVIHQRQYQGAHMACAMDWVYVGNDPTFYDIWIARGMTGDSFFNIPEDGSWNYAWNLFWNDPEARSSLHAGLPFQVFSCWNGIVAFNSQPVFEKKVGFRSVNDKECFQGEPKLFCKDLWHRGYGKIAVVPSVNVGYSVEEAQKLKKLKGYVSNRLSSGEQERQIAWKGEPPDFVKCMPGYEHQSFVPWNEGLSV